MKNQTGFGLVEGLLTVVVVGLIGVAGWAIYNKQTANKTIVENTSTGSMQEDQQEAEIPDEITEQPEASEIEERFSNSKLPFSFEYPEDWEKEIYDEGGLYSVTVIAPGTETTGQAYEAIVSGAKIFLTCRTTAHKTLEEFKSGDYMYTNNSSQKSQVVVSGASAEQYVVGYEGPPKRITTFYVDDQACDVAIEEDVYTKTNFKDSYDKVVSSIAF